MQPRHYLEFKILTGDSNRPSGATHDVMGLLFKFVHAIAARKGFKFGLALPQAKIGSCPTTGGIVRVFAQSREHLDALADELEPKPFIRDHVAIGRIKTIPDDYVAPGHVEHLRFRVPGKNSWIPASRAKKTDESSRYPHVRLNSSSGHEMTLFIKPIVHRAAPQFAPSVEQGGQEGQVGFSPDIYGLSVSSRRFALPLLPGDWGYARLGANGQKNQSAHA